MKSFESDQDETDKKRQISRLTELEDPLPAEVVLLGEESTVGMMEPADVVREVPDEKVLRAIAIYRELAEGVVGATQMLERIDAFLDPGRVEESTMLAVWRERYKNEITVRNKSRWWRRFRMASAVKKSKARK